LLDAENSFCKPEKTKTRPERQIDVSAFMSSQFPSMKKTNQIIFLFFL
jgi:hypothetical protein